MTCDAKAQELALGARGVFRRALTLRFGRLSIDQVSRLAAASFDDVLRAADRFFVATSVDDVFRDWPTAAQVLDCSDPACCARCEGPRTP
jgi:hypothetical protein